MHAPMRCYRHPDRETYVSCSECGRPICTECMTPAPVGQRCPEHSGRPQGVGRMTSGVRRAAYEGGTGIVTRVLIAINVLVYLAELATGAGINANSGWIYEKGVLVSSAIDSHGTIVGGVLGGQAIGIILINLVFSFTFAGISIGGHIGGLIGGALCMLALSRFGRGHGAYGRIGAVGIAGVAAVAVASVVIAYFRTRGYA